MLKRRKFAHPGGTDGKAMLLAPLDQRPSDTYYHDDCPIFSNLANMPERRHGRKGRLGTRLMRCRLVLPRVRIRMISPVRLFDKMRDSYLRLVLSHKKSDPAAVTPLYQYQGVSYSSDAIAECIEFIKKTAASDTRLL
ncbi:hypothetical protein Mapa_005898 [Marchantia paleacea]|nr:hypothetical protein Mapa_005898 [Marchantia paleacea]